MEWSTAQTMTAGCWLSSCSQEDRWTQCKWNIPILVNVCSSPSRTNDIPWIKAKVWSRDELYFVTRYFHSSHLCLSIFRWNTSKHEHLSDRTNFKIFVNIEKFESSWHSLSSSLCTQKHLLTRRGENGSQLKKWWRCRIIVRCLFVCLFICLRC